VIAAALKVGTIEEISANADALSAIHAALKQVLKQEVRVQVSGEDVYLIAEGGRTYRYVLINRYGMQFTGTFSTEEQTAIEAFVNGLPAAIAEQKMVTALATQLELISDEPVYNQQGRAVGRTLVVRV
jgi:hypothetical protein